MSIYHLNVKIISRGNVGKSIVAAAAYRSGSKIKDFSQNHTYNYTKKKEVVFHDVMLPENAPDEYHNSETLWNSVQTVETQKNAQLARDINIALPRECNREQHIEMLKKFINENFVKVGMCADVSIHDKNDGNPHAHILLTLRSIDENGKWLPKSRKEYVLDEDGNRILIKKDKKGRKQYKTRKIETNDWNDKRNVDKWRKAWQDVANLYLDDDHKIDCRSLADQGIERVPTVHEGPHVRAIDRERAARGQETTRVHQLNVEITQDNENLVAAEAEAARLEQEAKEAEARAAAAAQQKAAADQRLYEIQVIAEAALRTEEMQRAAQAEERLNRNRQNDKNDIVAAATSFSSEETERRLAMLRAYEKDQSWKRPKQQENFNESKDKIKNTTKSNVTTTKSQGTNISNSEQKGLKTANSMTLAPENIQNDGRIPAAAMEVTQVEQGKQTESQGIKVSAQKEKGIKSPNSTILAPEIDRTDRQSVPAAVENTLDISEINKDVPEEQAIQGIEVSASKQNGFKSPNTDIFDAETDRIDSQITAAAIKNDLGIQKKQADDDDDDDPNKPLPDSDAAPASGQQQPKKKVRRYLPKKKKDRSRGHGR